MTITKTLHKIEMSAGRDWLVYDVRADGTAELVDIHVGSDRRRGTGRALVQTMCHRLPVGTMVWAVTRMSNLIAQEFYEGLGWRVIGNLRRFYAQSLTEPTTADAVMYGHQVGTPI